jgi:hypothetical protein
MAYVIARFAVPDFDAWKKDSFDADLADRKQLAKGHRLYRGVAPANDVIVALEFPSPREARSFRRSLVAPEGFERAFGSGIENPRAWITEEVETQTY